MAIPKFLLRLPNYLKRFGPAHGLRIARFIERDLPVQSTTIESLSVPGFDRPIQLRASRGDHATFWQCMAQSQYEFDHYPQAARFRERYRQAVARGQQPLIIDCGANIGLASLWFGRQFPQARIVAIEPDSANLALLKANLAGMGDRVTVLHGGVWSTEGHVRIENPDDGSAAFRVVPCDADTAGAVQTYTIDGICARHGVASPFIAKVDIEGAQAELFRTATHWVRDTALIVLELDDWQFPWTGTSRPFFSCVSRWPFDYLLGGESIFCFRDFDAAADPAA